MAIDHRWDPQTWPATFQSFLADNGVSPEIYLSEPLRYVCVLEPQLGSEEALLRELPGAVADPFRPHCYTLPGSPSLAHTGPYRAGTLLAIDRSSVLAVDNVQLQSTDHVLDLCCAPGAKLVLMASRAREGSVTGVDISRERLGAAVGMAKKYRLSNARLFCADGRRFGTLVHRVMPHDHEGSAPNYLTQRPLWSSSKYRKRKGQLGGLYDKVLVDAQCTHDGSVKHIRKHVMSDWRYFEADHFTDQGLARLYELQYDLLCNGFNMLKEGGLLVYSTCSSSRHQNEEIVERFVASHACDARLESPEGCPDDIVSVCDGHALRIRPSPKTGGFFLCKIRKTQSAG